RRDRLRRGHRAELVPAAPARAAAAARGEPAAAGAAPVRRAPDPGAPDAHRLGARPGAVRAGPGGQHRRLAGPPGRGGAVRRGAGPAAGPARGVRLRIQRPVLAAPQEPGPLPVAQQQEGLPRPGRARPALARTGRRDGRRRMEVSGGACEVGLPWLELDAAGEGSEGLDLTYGMCRIGADGLSIAEAGLHDSHFGLDRSEEAAAPAPASDALLLGVLHSPEPA